MRDALVDFTGGISETFNLRNEDKLPPDLWDIVKTSQAMGSLLGCGIWVRLLFLAAEMEAWKTGKISKVFIAGIMDSTTIYFKVK